MKKYVRFEYVPWKESYFVLFPFFVFTLAIRLRNFDFDIVFFFLTKQYVTTDLNMFKWKNIYSNISIACVHFSHKTEKFPF